MALAAFQESFLYASTTRSAFSYSVSRFVLATKQPAMTAATLATIIREREARIAREDRVLHRAAHELPARAVSANILAVARARSSSRRSGISSARAYVHRKRRERPTRR